MSEMTPRELLTLIVATALGAAKQDFHFEMSVLQPSRRAYPDEIKQKEAENYYSISNRGGRTKVSRGEF